MTLDQLAGEVATEFGEQYGDLDVSLQFQKWAQESFDAIVAEARWFFKNATADVVPVAGTAVYTLPATVSEVRAAYISTTYGRVAYSTIERLLARGSNLAEAGTPRAWFYSGLDSATTGLKVQFWPVPNAALVSSGAVIRMETLSRPASLSPTDTIPLPSEYIRVMRDGIRFRVKFNDNDLEGARAAHTLFQDGLALLNSRFHGAEEGGSSLRIKRLKASRQAPGATEEG